MTKRRKRRGHFCWSCGRIRPNERFSGRGHARHLCRDCSKLGSDELEYRQSLRDIDRVLGWHEFIPRRARGIIERKLQHPNERVRDYVPDLLARDARRRADGQAFVDEGSEPELEP